MLRPEPREELTGPHRGILSPLFADAYGRRRRLKKEGRGKEFIVPHMDFQLHGELKLFLSGPGSFQESMNPSLHPRKPDCELEGRLDNLLYTSIYTANN